MSVSNTSGRIYDIGEVPRLEAFIKEQQDAMDKIDSEKSVQDKKILRYALLLGGVAITLVLFKYLVDKRK
jgi:hypothetical protein